MHIIMSVFITICDRILKNSSKSHIYHIGYFKKEIRGLGNEISNPFENNLIVGNLLAAYAT